MAHLTSNSLRRRRSRHLFVIGEGTADGLGSELREAPPALRSGSPIAYASRMADTTESSIVIDAEPGIVLDVIADLEAYPEWAGEIKQVEILAEEGDGWPDRLRRAS